MVIVSIFFYTHTHLILTATRYSPSSPPPPLGEDVLMKSLAELENTEGELCCVVGTIFKKMELQPSILKEISAKVSNLSTESPAP